MELQVTQFWTLSCTYVVYRLPEDFLQIQVDSCILAGEPLQNKKLLYRMDCFQSKGWHNVRFCRICRKCSRRRYSIQEEVMELLQLVLQERILTLTMENLDLWSFDLLVVHSIWGFPWYPGAQVQTPRCSKELQRALIPQTSTLHASTQTPLTHFSAVLHSESNVHWGFSYAIALHLPEASVNESGGQVHIIVRSGSVSNTRHCWSGVHICPREQGFWQRALMQANWDGHSASSRHSGWGAGGKRGIVHSTNGSPVAPGGQVHLGWCCWPMQVAVSAHVSSSQTGLQTRLSRSQVSWSAQSSLYWQTPAIHESNGLPWVPTGQRHWATCTWTAHSAPLPHVVDMHGFKQCSLMQALS